MFGALNFIYIPCFVSVWFACLEPQKFSKSLGRVKMTESFHSCSKSLLDFRFAGKRLNLEFQECKISGFCGPSKHLNFLANVRKSCDFWDVRCTFVIFLSRRLFRFGCSY